MTYDERREHVVDAIDLVGSIPLSKGPCAPRAAATCTTYRFKSGVLQEGLQLPPNSSMQMLPALFVGTRFVRVDIDNPCTIDQDFMVHDASIRWVGKDSHVALLSRRNPTEKRIFVHVDTQFTRVKGAYFKYAFSSEIISDGEIVAWDKSEQFIGLAHGETIDVLYGDGSVRSLVNLNGKLELKSLGIEEMADIRILFIRQKQAQIRENLQSSQRMAADDRLYHELVSMMEIGGNRSLAIFDRLYLMLEDDASQGLLGGGVKDRILEVLQSRPSYALRFRTTFVSRGSISEPTTTKTVLPSTFVPAKPKGPPPEAKARKAARAERDRQARNAARGSSADKSQKGGGKQSKKK